MSALTTVFGTIVRQSWQAGVLALLLLLLKRMLGSRLAPRWHSALWLLVIARLLLPTTPASFLSLENYASPGRALALLQNFGHRDDVRPAAAGDGVARVSRSAGAIVPGVLVASRQQRTHPSSVLALVWAGGAIVFLVRFARNILLVSRIGRRAVPVQNPEVLEAFREASRQVGVNRKVQLAQTGELNTPALLGIVRPMVLLPMHAESALTAQEMRYVLVHELSHLCRGDIALGLVASMLQAAHWFNPVLWYVTNRMRIDREIACDAAVLALSGTRERENYGRTILRLTEQFSSSGWSAVSAGILENKTHLRRRIDMITSNRRPVSSGGWVALIAAGLMGMVTFTSAQTGGKHEETTSNSSTSVVFNSVLLEVNEARIRDQKAAVNLDELARQHHHKMLESLRAFEVQGLVNVVAGPSIVVDDGETASFEIHRLLPAEDAGTSTARNQKDYQLDMTVTPEVVSPTDIRVELKIDYEGGVGEDIAPTANEPATKVRTVVQREATMKTRVRDGGTIVVGLDDKKSSPESSRNHDVTTVLLVTTNLPKK